MATQYTIDGREEPIDPPPPQELVILRAAVEKGAGIDTIERLSALWERKMAQEAELAFNNAMNRAQQEMGPVSADAENPQTHSKYASYWKLDKALRPIYSRHGFSISYNTAESPKADHTRVLAYVSHSAGHTRTYQTDMPNDGKGAKGGDVMTKTHAQGAAMTYGMRYLLKLIFNVAIGEDDNDGNGCMDNLPAFLERIRGCATEAQLTDIYREAIKAALAVTDTNAIRELAKAKGARMKAGFYENR